jgi:hypothetical protein
LPCEIHNYNADICKCDTGFLDRISGFAGFAGFTDKKSF